ncbi:MAG: trigger factor [Candidatus Parcubacteria bacterium]|jgi:FKBP-type peptidyl-prolyl cis-trans isomerase (trigger factor)|nr:trigger factor [Candidatus Parcubacteria bacterium]
MPESPDPSKSYGSVSINKLDKSRIEIEGSIPAEIWEKFRPQALKHLNETFTVDGFRKGMVPDNILTAKVGQAAVSEKMAELALRKAYIDILTDHAIDAIGEPEVRITKLATGNPLEFKAVTAVVPEVKLPDYRKLAAAELKKSSPDELAVTESDVEAAILRIRKARVSHESHDHDEMSPEEHEKAVLDSLPEFNDDFVRGMGDFKDLEDFKQKVRVMIGENKKDEVREKLRLRIADALSGGSTIELPEVAVESELARTEAQFKLDIEKMGVKLDDYLKHSKKTLEDIRKEWRPHAEKKAKLQLILDAIARAENIKPAVQEIENEVTQILAHYKDADRERAAVYAETVLSNEKVFEWLERHRE